ncbi:MAG: hypothetical protein FWF50_00220, partial [Defluviitaleaceae bacterium]|nr:hypothetical protein [Defluviitaleaceae bacterium]
FTLLGGRGGVGGINTETTTARAGQQGTDRSIHASWAVSGSDNQGQQGIGDRQNRVSTTTITHPNFPANNSAAAAFVRHNIGTQPAINGSLSNREAVFNGGSEAAGLRGRGGGGAGGGFRTIGGAGAVLSSRTPHTSPQNAFGQTGSSTRSNGSNGTVGFIEIQF